MKYFITIILLLSSLGFAFGQEIETRVYKGAIAQKYDIEMVLDFTPSNGEDCYDVLGYYYYYFSRKHLPVRGTYRKGKLVVHRYDGEKIKETFSGEIPRLGKKDKVEGYWVKADNPSQKVPFFVKKLTGFNQFPCIHWAWNIASGEIQLPFSNCVRSEKDDPADNIIHLQGTRPKILEKLTKDSTYTDTIKVAGQPFTGKILMYYRFGDKRVLEVNLVNGLRDGSFKAYSERGDLAFENLYDNGLFISQIYKQVIPEGMILKPIIYLYPDSTQEISVSLDLQGQLAHTYPLYPKQRGWQVEAKPDGSLKDLTNGQEYYGLYWEAKDRYSYDLSTGFVVKAEQTASFLDKKLSHLGLNRREANEFMVFWLPRLEKNPYNLIHFSDQEYTDRATLEISPKPKTLIRVFMVSQPLNEPIKVKKQYLNPVRRKGFTVVEWGGQQIPKYEE